MRRSRAERLGGLIGRVLAEHQPPDVEAAEVFGPPRPPLRRGAPFAVACWNLQFAGSRRHRFFYDGGDAVHVPASDVAQTLAGIAGALEELAPDVCLLQEIDRDSARTGRLDQLRYLLDQLPPRRWTSAPYYRAPHVPYPPGRHLGRMNMHLALLSAFDLENAERLALPLLRESRLRRMFNLKRAILAAEIPVEGGKPLRVACTHLSAFSRGDGTMAKQVEVLRAWMAAQPPDQPWILGGDLNLLPPGDSPARLAVEAELYADDPNPIQALIPEFREVFSDPLAEHARTYLPFGAPAPDRKIDYLFAGGPLAVEAAEVGRRYDDLSDHLPLRATLRITA